MEPVLKSLTLKRFRSFPSETVTFANPTFLVGQNGAGKSNFVDAFAFLSEVMSSPLQAVFDRRGGLSAVRNRTSIRSYPPNLGMCVVLENRPAGIKTARYAFEVAALKDYGFEVVREQCVVERTTGPTSWFDRNKKGKQVFGSSHGVLNPVVEPNALMLPLIGGASSFNAVFRCLSQMRVYSIQPARLREMQDPDSGATLHADGSNAASVLREIKRQSNDEWLRVCELLETVVPKTKRVDVTQHGNKLSLEFTQEWDEKKSLTFEAFNMSDGTLRTLGLLAAVHQQQTPSVIVIEEPESTIHPGALGSVLDLLRSAAQRMQVVVTTHSPELLDAKWIGDEHLRMVDWSEGASRIGAVSESSRLAMQQHLMGAGELLRSNGLHAAPSLFDERSPDQKSQRQLFDETLP